MNVEELRKDLGELKKFHEQAERQTVKSFLLLEVQRIEKQISSSESAAKKKAEGSGEATKTVVKEIKNYAWDQSGKFMKIYVSDDMDGIKDISEENVKVEYTYNSCKLKVNGLKCRDYVCHVAPLYSEIVPEECKFKIKTDMVLIMLKKSEEGDTWAQVTGKGEKAPKAAAAAADPKAAEPGAPGAPGAKDPSEGLMDMMKKMYDEGDDEMKRTISKAWEESQNKKQAGGQV